MWQTVFTEDELRRMHEEEKVMKYRRDPSLNFRYFRTRQLSRSTVGTVAVKEKMRYPAGYGMRRQRE